MKFKHTLLMLGLCGALGLIACNPDHVDSSSSEDKSDPSITVPDTGSEPEIQDGSREHPYLISNKQDLIDLQEMVNSDTYEGFVQDINAAPYYELTADIDLEGMEWEAIGSTLNETASNIFSANFDGNGHTITNFKITRHKASLPAYGLFGFFHGYMHDLNVTDFTIDLAPTNVYSTNVIGGAVAYADLAAFDNLNVEGSINYTFSKSNKSVVIGGAIGFADNHFLSTPDGDKGAATFTRFVTTNVEIISNYENAFIGGVIGYSSTTGGQAVNNISYVSAEGSIEGSNMVGGITSFIDKYTTISFAIVKSEYIIGRVVSAGIAGVASNDTVVNNSIVAAKNITVAETQPNGDLSVGSVLGLYAPNNDPEYMELSSLMMDVYVANNTKITLGAIACEDINNTPVESISNLINKVWLEENLGFSTVEFSFYVDNYPTIRLGADIDYSAQVDVEFQTNMIGIKVDPIQLSKYNFTAYSLKKPNKAGYTFKGWFYDKEKTVDYRFYLPMQFNTTLYGDWAKYSDFANMYVSTSKYGMILDFNEDGTMAFYYSDYTYSRGEYAYYDDYLYFETDATLTDGGWGLTFANWDGKNLTFSSSNASSTLFNYEVASSLIGYYRSGLNAIDFLTTCGGKLTLPTENELLMIRFDYTLQENGEIIATAETDLPLEINTMSDGSLSVTYNGKTYDSFNKIAFDATYENNDQTPWVGKNYRGPELNNDLGVKDIEFGVDGTVLMRTSYTGRNNVDPAKPIDQEKSDFANGTIHWEFSYSEDPRADRFIREITLNKDKKTYTYTEKTVGYMDGVEKEEVMVLSRNMTKQVLKDGSSIFTGTHQAYGQGSLYNVEFVVDSTNTNIHYSFFVNHYYGGGFYNEGDDVIIKSASGLDTINTVLHYHRDADYFTMTGNNGVHFMLAPYEINGVFTIKGSDALKGQVYSYVGHTYYLDENGSVSDVTIISGSFANDDDVTVSIKGQSYSFAVVNLFQDNVLNIK